MSVKIKLTRNSVEKIYRDETTESLWLAKEICIQLERTIEQEVIGISFADNLCRITCLVAASTFKTQVYTIPTVFLSPEIRELIRKININ